MFMVLYIFKISLYRDVEQSKFSFIYKNERQFQVYVLRTRKMCSVHIYLFIHYSIFPNLWMVHNKHNRNKFSICFYKVYTIFALTPKFQQKILTLKHVIFVIFLMFIFLNNICSNSMCFNVILTGSSCSIKLVSVIILNNLLNKYLSMLLSIENYLLKVLKRKEVMNTKQLIYSIITYMYIHICACVHTC